MDKAFDDGSFSDSQAAQLRSFFSPYSLLEAANEYSELNYRRAMILAAAQTGDASFMLTDLLEKSIPAQLACELVAFLRAIPVSDTDGFFLSHDDLSQGMQFSGAPNGNTYLNWFNDVADDVLRGNILNAVISYFCEYYKEDLAGGQSGKLYLFDASYCKSVSPLLGKNVSEPITDFTAWRARRIAQYRLPVRSGSHDPTEVDGKVLDLKPYLANRRAAIAGALNPDSLSDTVQPQPQPAEVVSLYAKSGRSYGHYTQYVDQLPGIDTKQGFVSLCVQMSTLSCRDDFFRSVLWKKGLEQKDIAKFLKFLQNLPITEEGIATEESVIYDCPTHSFNKRSTLNFFNDLPKEMQQELISVLAAYWYAKRYYSL